MVVRAERALAAGKHLLIAGQQLEDPAGNSPSRAFEEENSSSPRPGPTYVPFTIQ